MLNCKLLVRQTNFPLVKIDYTIPAEKFLGMAVMRAHGQSRKPQIDASAEIRLKPFATSSTFGYSLRSGSRCALRVLAHSAYLSAAITAWSFMWKSPRKEEELSTPTSGPLAATAATAPNMHTPTRPTEPLRSDHLRTAEVAAIGKSVVVKGELSGSEDLYIDGQVEGSIALRGQTLTVGANGRVLANIEARNLIVHGRVEGGVHVTDRVELRKTASLSGDIFTARISIEDGAFFKGTIEIQKPDPAPQTEARPQFVAAAAGTSSAQSLTPVSAQGSPLESKKF